MIIDPKFLSIRPKKDDDNGFKTNPESDVLADVLKSLGLFGHVFCRAKMNAPWALAVPPDNMAHFHYIERGVCCLKLDGESTIYNLTAGDIAVLPTGPGHILTDKPGQSSISIKDLIKDISSTNGCAVIRHGGNGAETQMLCGSFQFQHGREGFLLPFLPQVIHLSALAEDVHPLLETTLRFIAHEASQPKPGNQLVLTRLVEILFVQVLRTWLENNPEDARASWLMALKEKPILTALSCMHTRPEHHWTVASLAACANMSRSPFAALFKKVVGEGPLTYLRRWRIRTAASLLEETDMPIAEISRRTGYRSETSFSKTFKDMIGCSPIQWRRQTSSSSVTIG